MDLKLTQENLSKALSIVARVASGRSTLPILSNILLKTNANRLQLSATNLDIAITEFVGAKVTKEGSITVPARLMQDFVSNLPSGTVSLSQKDNRLDIKTENYSSTLNGISAEDFPVMPLIAEGKQWEISSIVLKKAFQQVVGAASSDDARPILTGVFLSSHDKKLFIAATDSYRLAEKTIDNITDEIKMLIPVNAAQELLRVLDDTDDKVKITSDGQQVRFQTSKTELIARMIEGEYPDYQKLIPNKFERTATADRSELINITKVSSLFARESAGSIILKLEKDNGKITVASVASQVGENSSSATAKVCADGELTLNSRYLLEGLQALEGNQVEINFSDKLDPLLLRNPKNKDYLHIVMPLKS
ncbi:MAG TPA: DNA polymerase III subunit beta [Candidatus Saccharibacteria bacterium]|nr:DNA polymerase III subunit beta [Candidatus Saccharibacteria bacterium]